MCKNLNVFIYGFNIEQYVTKMVWDAFRKLLLHNAIMRQANTTLWIIEKSSGVNGWMNGLVFHFQDSIWAINVDSQTNNARYLIIRRKSGKVYCLGFLTRKVKFPQLKSIRYLLNYYE